MLRHVDLCSGIGGFALGFQWAGLSKPVMFCDIEPWSRKILAKHWPDVPIEEDVKVLANEPERIPECSILTAGYPCQPFSQAGKRRGEEDDRHIWPYIREIVAQKRPTWCVFENVYGHLSMGLDTVLSNLEADGYSTRPFIVPACGVDAAHRRDRIWIIARNISDTKSIGLQGVKQARCNGESGDERLQPEPAGICRGEHSAKNVDDAEGDRNSGRLSDLSRKNEKTSKPQEQHKDATIKSDDASEHTAVLGYSDNARGGTSRRTTDEKRQATEQGWQEQSQSGISGSSADVADSTGERCSRAKWAQSEGAREGFTASCKGKKWQWKPEPRICRVAYGLPNRVDRIRGLGNAIVPQIAMQIGLTIKAVNDDMEYEKC